jgi:tol-pal system protein YbgF
VQDDRKFSFVDLADECLRASAKVLYADLRLFMRFKIFVPCLTLLSLGCAQAPNPALVSLEAEVRRLRSDQERMSSQIEQMNNRLVLTEDTARAARIAVDSGDRRRVIRLGADATSAEPIRVDSTTRNATEDAGDGTNRTVIRATRGDRPQDPTGFSVVQPSERLPVAPAPPIPAAATAPATRPATVPVPGSPVVAPVRGPGASWTAPGVAPALGVLDPAAVGVYDSALALARGGHCPEAVGAFAQFLSRWPAHPHADNAMYWRAECLLQGGDMAQATREFEALVAHYPGGNKVPDALYKLATTYARLGDGAASTRAAQRLASEFPDSEAARRIRSERE